MPAIGVPGPQAIPNPISAIPVTRATVMAVPMSPAPSNNLPTKEGTDSNATPIAVSHIEATINNFFI